MMPRTCTICSSPERPAIEAALVTGTGYRDIAGRYGLSKSAVERHRADHIPRAVAEAHEAREEAQALDIVRQLKAINGAALAILHDARAARDHEVALKAIDRVQRQIELQARLLGAIDDRPQVNVLVMPDFVAARTVLMAALAPYLDARIAVAAALASLEEGSTAGESNGHRR
jgi:hypothetical protein